MQICVTLVESEPSIWRRLIVPWTWHLGHLHLLIQAAFNWQNCHLHEFRIGGLRYGDPEIEDWGHETSPHTFNEREVRLLDFEHEPGIAFAYIYDFGDNWHHAVEIEKHLTLDTVPRFGTCVDGARARPPEDVGGMPGYEQFLAVMANPADPEHADMKRWCGGHFDPEWFNVGLADKDVRSALKPGVRRRLHQPKPRHAGRPS